MDENTMTILSTDLHLLIQNIADLSSALAAKNHEVEKLASMGAEWVRKYHEQKTKVAQLERQIKELQNGLPS
jgi:chromosome segregation ATPase